MNYIQVIRVIVSESMTVSDSEAHKLGDTNKLSAGETSAKIHRISLIANSSNTITVLKHVLAQLPLCFN